MKAADDRDPPCAYCGAPRSKHCPGNVVHDDPKGHGTHKCVSRHCLSALCCCVNYEAPKKGGGGAKA